MSMTTVVKPSNQATEAIEDPEENIEDTSDAVGTPANPDFGLQIDVEEILVDVDPSLSLDYLQRANALAGHPPPSRTPKDKLIKTHVHHVEKQRRAHHHKRPRMVKRVILALSYAPSTASTADLTRMPLGDLLVENHHEEKMIVVKTVTPPYHGAGTVTIVEDEWGNVEKLALYNQGDSSVLSAPPEGSIILVREPYYKFSGENDFMICVDQPTDALLLRHGPDDHLIPDAFRQPEKYATAVEWKDAGDRAFMIRNFPQAKLNYSRGLEVVSPDEATLKTGLHAKRAGVNLSLKCYDEAVTDALASRGGSADWRSYFVAARAAYELTHFKKSREYFEAAMALSPTTPNVQKEFQRCLARVEEEEEGTHDWASIAQSVTSRNIHLDKASFITKTEVRDSPHHGRGLFASCDIKAGEIIYVEKSTCVPNEFNPEHNSAAAYAQLVELCKDNPSIHSKVLDLYGGTYKRTGLEGTIVNGQQLVDVYLLESIRRKNCFSGTHISAKVNDPNWRTWKQGMSRGLWVYSAYSNHACMPNSNRAFVGDMMISTAVVDIPAGTEVTQIYLPPKAVYQRRAKQYRATWGFDCDCTLCVGERKSPTENHSKRMELLGEIEKMLKKKGMSPAKHQPDAQIRTIERVAAKLEAAHEEEVYGALPRLMMVWPDVWLMDAWRTRKKWNKVVKYALDLLRNFGYLDTLRYGEGGEKELWVHKDQVAITTFETIKALKMLEEAWRVLGDEGLAAQAREAGMTSLKVMAGFVTEESYAAFK